MAFQLENVSHLMLYGVVVLFLYHLSKSVHDVFFGPLSKFPGPKLWAYTHIPRLFAQAAGVESPTHKRLHDRYGPVVRVGPRELSFANGVQAWKDIYGHRKNGQLGTSKDRIFYDNPAEPVPSILGANDADHSRVRRILAPALSEKAAVEQEPLLKRWADTLQMKLSMHANGTDKVDMLQIFVCTAFDIMGDLSFSENLNMLHDTKYNAWVDNIFAGVKIATILRSFRQWSSWTLYLVDEVLAKTQTAKNQMEEHSRYTMERVDRRLQRIPEHQDFWSKILSKEEGQGGLSLDEQYANASFLMMAGADTTAGALSGTTFFLLRNPDCLRTLTTEIREAFSSLEEVTLEKASKLQYLQAVLHEGMRMYPPNPISLLRTVPKGGMIICDEYVPEDVNVAVNHLAISRSKDHFMLPDEFHPERWLGAEKFKNDHLDASQPFMVGPRNCSGQNIAWHELRLLMIGTLLTLDLELSEESVNWNEQRMWTFWEKKPLLCTMRPATV